MHYALAVLSSNSDGVLHVRSTTLFSIPLRVVPSLSDKSVLQNNVGFFFLHQIRYISSQCMNTHNALKTWGVSIRPECWTE
jgi:hypothetical protein